MSEVDALRNRVEILSDALRPANAFGMTPKEMIKRIAELEAEIAKYPELVDKWYVKELQATIKRLRRLLREVLTDVFNDDLCDRITEELGKQDEDKRA